MCIIHQIAQDFSRGLDLGDAHYWEQKWIQKLSWVRSLFLLPGSIISPPELLSLFEPLLSAFVK